MRKAFFGVTTTLMAFLAPAESMVLAPTRAAKDDKYSNLHPNLMALGQIDSLVYELTGELPEPQGTATDFKPKGLTQVASLGHNTCTTQGDCDAEALGQGQCDAEQFEWLKKKAKEAASWLVDNTPHAEAKTAVD